MKRTSIARQIANQTVAEIEAANPQAAKSSVEQLADVIATMAPVIVNLDHAIRFQEVHVASGRENVLCGLRSMMNAVLRDIERIESDPNGAAHLGTYLQRAVDIDRDVRDLRQREEVLKNLQSIRDVR